MGADTFPMVQHALHYASRRWFVFPLIDKRPRIKGGFHGASIDPAQIEEWWRQWPDANIGIATGASKLGVVDIDGPEGEKEFLEQLAPLSETLCAATGKGFHLYYSDPAGKLSSAQVRGRHIDTRGTTGYVVAPPSLHPSGIRYRWVNNNGLALIPEKLISWNCNRSAGSTGSPTKGGAEVPTKDRLVGPTTRRAHPADPAGGAAPPSATQGKRRDLNAVLEAQARAGSAWSPAEEHRLRSALAAIPANLTGDRWFAYGAAIHDLGWVVDGVDRGFEIWHDWSSTSKGKGVGNGEYKGRGDLEKRWVHFQRDYKGIRTTVASIYKHARERGWVYQGGLEREDVNENNNKNNNINGAKVVFAHMPGAGPPIWVDFNRSNFPTNTCTNTRIALRHMGVKCKYDVFHNRQYVAGSALDQWAGEIADDVVLVARSLIKASYGFDPENGTVIDALGMECQEHRYDPVLDYVDGLEWDGRPRLQTWTSDFLGVPITIENQIIGGLALIAAVRRARQPGCKFDHIIVLEGLEGVGKSSAVSILAGEENFSDQAILAADERQQQELIQGVWLYEIAELTGMRRAEIEHVKAFVTRTTDRARPAYGRKRVDRPRRCVFFATCNDQQYLISQTGNRRFLPLACGRVDLDGLARSRDQLWAEAAYNESRFGALVLPELLAPKVKLLQDSRLAIDPWEDILQSVEKDARCGKDQDEKEHRITTQSLIRDFLKVPENMQTTPQYIRLGAVMRKLGWDGPKLIKVFFFIDDKENEKIKQERGFSKGLKQ